MVSTAFGLYSRQSSLSVVSIWKEYTTDLRVHPLYILCNIHFCNRLTCTSFYPMWQPLMRTSVMLLDFIRWRWLENCLSVLSKPFLCIYKHQVFHPISPLLITTTDDECQSSLRSRTSSSGSLCHSDHGTIIPGRRWLGRHTRRTQVFSSRGPRSSDGKTAIA